MGFWTFDSQHNSSFLLQSKIQKTDICFEADMFALIQIKIPS